MELTRRRLLVGAGGAGVVAIGGGAYYRYGRSYQPDEGALQSVSEDDRVTVSEADVGYLVSSGDLTAATTGLVLYPGGRVDPESYVPTAAALVADRDLLVVIPEFLLDLAVLDSDRADDAIAAVPEIDRWYVGGHSLGGAMACRYATEQSERVEGLLLLGAYCDQDISGTSLSVLSILGTADEVIDREAEREGRALLPEDARIVEIEGMVHSQFGAYGPQRGDGEPSISDETARQAIATAVGEWLDDQHA